MLIQTANSGAVGINGIMVLSTGTSSYGNSGGIYIWRVLLEAALALCT
jgi:hypothetical protein